MWLIVGLGNPGSKYLLTRHNLGFMAVDYLAKSVGVRNDDGKSEFQALTIDFKWDTEQVKLVKPQTYMNLSGQSVGEIVRYFKVDLKQVVVVHDEIDIPFGRMRLNSSASAGGHNGIKSLIEHFGTNEFPRVRVGVGRSPFPGVDAADHVLQLFSKEEQEKLPEVLNATVDAIEAIVFDGMTKAMNVFNGKGKEE